VTVSFVLPIVLSIASVAAVDRPFPTSVHDPVATPAIGRVPFDVMTPDLDVNESDAENGAIDHPETTRSAAVAEKRTTPVEPTPEV